MSKQDDARAQYIAVATQKFAETGYHGTSLDAVAREAGVTKQALLHFFGTKSKLYAAVLSDLAERLTTTVATRAVDDPVAHLSACFSALGLSHDTVGDTRLVVRALLDIEAGARTWPMKPYIDALVSVARRLPGEADRPDAETLAWIVQMIGTIQYFTISYPALQGMYGIDVGHEVAKALDMQIVQAVRDRAR